MSKNPILPKVNIKAFRQIAKSGFFKNSAWSVLDVLVYPLLMLVSAPIFLHRLGAEQAGIWGLVNSVIASLYILNIGMADATIRFVSKYRGNNVNHKIERVIGTTFTIYLGLAVMVVCLCYGLAELSSYTGWPKIEEKHRALTVISIKIAGLTFGLRLVEQIFLAVFKGFERYDLSSQISIVSKTLILSLNLVWVLMGYGLVFVFASSALVTFLILVTEAVILTLKYPEFSIWPKIDREVLKEVSGYSLWGWFQAALGIASRNADKFVVTQLAGLEVFAYYNLAFSVSNQIHSLFVAMSSWVFPTVSRRIEQGEDIKRFFNSMNALIVGAGSLTIVTVLMVRPILFTLWLGPASYRQTIVFIEGFLYYGLLVLTTIVPFFFFNGAGKIRVTFGISCFVLGVQLVSMVVMNHFFGVKGLPWALVVMAIIVVPVAYYYFDKVILDTVGFFHPLVTIIPGLLFIVSAEMTNWYLKIPLLAAGGLALKLIFFDKADLKASFAFLNKK